MIEKRYKTLGGLEAPIQIFETVEEAEKQQPGALLSQANQKLVYHGVLNTVRELICNKLEDETKIERESKVVGKTKAGKDVLQWENPGDYVERVMAKQGWNDLSSLQPWLDTACREFVDEEGAKPEPLAVDLTERVRTPKAPARLAAKFKQSAAVAIVRGRIDALNAKFAETIKKQFTATDDTSKMFEGTAEVGTEQVPFNVSDKDAEALGWLIKEWREWEANKQVDGLLG